MNTMPPSSAAHCCIQDMQRREKLVKSRIDSPWKMRYNYIGIVVLHPEWMQPACILAGKAERGGMHEMSVLRIR